MARADSEPTTITRRTAIRLAYAAAVIPVTIDPSFAEDAELIGLSHQLEQVSVAINACKDGEKIDDLCRQGKTIADQINEYQATTVPGLKAKVIALIWFNGARRDEWDDTNAYDLAEDIVAMTMAVG